MTNIFERFDQAEARFAKLFAAFVLLLVASLIVADLVVSAFRDQEIETLSPATGSTTQCKTMPDGTRVCDFTPPGGSNSI